MCYAKERRHEVDPVEVMYLSPESKQYGRSTRCVAVYRVGTCLGLALGGGVSGAWEWRRTQWRLAKSYLHLYYSKPLPDCLHHCHPFLPAGGLVLKCVVAWRLEPAALMHV